MLITVSSVSLSKKIQPARLLLAIVQFFLLPGHVSVATAQTLCINEVMSANIDEVLSPAVNFDGWIEVFNKGSVPLNLTGLWLSDDAAHPKKWRIGSGFSAVAAQGFATIFFDHNDIDGRQAPFKLDVDGGTLLLSNQVGGLIDRVDYPAAVPHMAYARRSDGGDQWGMTATPTPGGSNRRAVFASAQAEAPQVSLDDQLFTGSLTVRVTVPKGATLRYTTDGSLPTLTNGATSTDGVFTFVPTRCFRFRCFKEGLLPSEVVTRSYIQANKDYTTGRVLSVVTDPRYLYDDQIGIMVKGSNGRTGNGQAEPCNWNMDWQRPAHFSLLDTSGHEVFSQDVNIQMCGGWSRAYEPHSFKLKGNKKYGQGKTLDYPFFTAKPYIRNRTLQVRNGGNDNYCRLKDAALQTIIQTSGIDIDVQSYEPVHVFLNGRYTGTLNMREPNNKDFVFANYGWDDDEIDQFEMSPDSGYVQKCGSRESFQRLYDLTSQAADEQTWNEIVSRVDIDEYINYMAMQLYLGSDDWPRNNLKGFARKDGGRYRFVCYDLDMAFNRSSSMFTHFAQMQTWTFDWLFDQQTRLTKEIEMVTIFLNLLQNDEFRRRFATVFSLMGGSVFEASRCEAVVDSLAARVRPMMVQGNTQPDPTAQTLKDKLRDRMPKMMKALHDFQPMQLGETTLRTLTLQSRQRGARLYLNGELIPTGYFNGQAFAPAKVSAEAPAGYRFKHWEELRSGHVYSSQPTVQLQASDLSLVAVFTPDEALGGDFMPVVINEVSAGNDVAVSDYFKRSDWIELYNRTSQPVDIAGWRLSTDGGHGYIAQGNGVASTIVPPYGFCIVWCDRREPLSQLHCGIKLPAAGGSVELTTADGMRSDILHYTAHDGNASVGRSPDGGDRTYVFSQPTIGKPNLRNSYAQACGNVPAALDRTIGAQKAELTVLPGRLIVRHNGHSPLTVALYAISGIRLWTATIPADEQYAEFSTNSFPPGCYILQMGDEKTKIVTK